MQLAGLPYQNPLTYTGPPVNLVPIKVFKRIPTTTDVKYRIGQLVIIGKDAVSGTEGDLWYLSEFDSSGNAIWLQLLTGAGSPGVDSITTDDGSPPVLPDGTGNVNILGGTGISITGNGPGDTVTIAFTGGSVVTTMTGDVGGAISPDVLGNTNVLGSGGLTVTGTALTNTLTIAPSSGGSLIETLTGNSGAPVVPDGSANIDIVGGSGVNVAGSANTLTITSTALALTWSVVTTATQAITTANGYFADRGAGVTFTLPATAAIGDFFKIVNVNAGGFTLAQNAGQSIIIGDQTTTTGIGGSLASTAVGDTLEIACFGTNTSFVLINPPQGNITFV
jgi:hypothetical protein